MSLDAEAIAKLALKVGLVTENQIQDAWDEVGVTCRDAEKFLLALERKGHLTPLQSQKLLKGDSTGYFLGGFRILYKISSGSFGRVFRADEPQTGRIVAVKVLRRRFSEDQKRIGLFDREGKVGLTLRHPNIVEVLSVGRDPGSAQYHIAMEFVEGGNLREILAIRKKLEPHEALRIIEECVSALVYAYSKGVTHRDMKLTNVLISSQGVAKLVDFGLAGFFTSSIQHRGEDGEHVDRTVDYAGLEKTTGVKSGDVRSDIYFLGCILYEMLTGRSPLLMTRDPRKRMEKERFANVLPMRKDEVNAPPSTFRLVETMMALNPQMRYQTPSQLLEAIRDARRDLEGKDATRQQAQGPKSLFLVEANERMQETLREKLKEMGYRVFLASDPARAVDRYRQQPYDGIVLDARTTGEEGLYVFERVMQEATRQGLPCAGILVLGEDQADWSRRIRIPDSVAILTEPPTITLRQLQRQLQELVPLPNKSTE